MGTRTTLVAALLLIVGVVVAMRYRSRSVVREGGIYSVEIADGKYGVAKVLILEPGIVHVRTYAQRYSSRPASVDEASLTMGTIHDKEFGVGHLPLQPAGFSAWQPVLIKVVQVRADELDGYEEWKRAGGGVWN